MESTLESYQTIATETIAGLLHYGISLLGGQSQLRPKLVPEENLLSHRWVLYFMLCTLVIWLGQK